MSFFRCLGAKHLLTGCAGCKVFTNFLLVICALHRSAISVKEMYDKKKSENLPTECLSSKGHAVLLEPRQCFLCYSKEESCKKALLLGDW